MAFVSEMVDELRLLLDDASDTQVPIATKRLFLNRGIARLWPEVWRYVTLEIALDEAELDYAITVPWSADAEFRLLSVEYEDTDGLRSRFSDYDFLSTDEDSAPTIRLTAYPEDAASLHLRMMVQIPLIVGTTYAAMGSEEWTGPDRAIGLPVLYAMAMITAAKIDNRQDLTNYNAQLADNGVTDRDIMAANQLWMGQFELELDKSSRMPPPAKD